MKRFLWLAFLLVGCAREDRALVPLSAEESRSIRGALLAGRSIAPGEKIAAAADCGAFVKSLPGFRAGTLEVPEDWDQPATSPKIRVFYYWRVGTNPELTPVVFFNGGPGADSHGSAQTLAPLAFTKKNSFVFLDQRGTGCSTPFPAAENEATVKRLEKWGSRGIVGDAEAVRQHLFGNRAWRAFGQSYGGLITHRYIEIAPRGLERAIVHGHSVMSDAADWMAERIRSQRRVAEDFFARYPEDRAVLEFARRAIPADRCWTMKRDRVCGPRVLDSLTVLLGFQSSWPDLDQWINFLRTYDGKLEEQALDQLVRNFVFGMYGAGGLAGEVLSKMEITPGYDSITGCAEAMKRLRESGEDADAFPINECRLLGFYESPFPALMKNLKSNPISLEGLRASLQRDVRFFLFSGRQDVFVPEKTFEEEVKYLEGFVRYKAFPNSGHEGFFTEKEVTDAVTR